MDVLKGLRIVIPTNNLAFSQLAKGYLDSIKKDFYDLYGRELKILVLTKQTVNDENRHLMMNSEDWINYDILIYTSIVLNGISFEHERYDKIYGSFVNMSNNADECCQMLLRVRN
jgi:hypothetical protein